MDITANIARATLQRQRHIPFLRRNVERTMASDARLKYRNSSYESNTTNGNEERHVSPPEPAAIIQVPDIPHRLFDSTSRQPLQPKARIADWKDHVDETWRVSKQIDSLVSSHLISDTTKQYMITWNTFMIR